MEYTFIKDYKQNKQMRDSFIKLARDTFGIDFGRWYEAGFWNDNYICFSFEYGGEIVSNVSVNLMRLIMDGRESDAVQIGTVMTSPGHRRKGLARRLLERATEDCKGREFFFLAAAEDAVPLYSSCGFEPSQSYKYIVDLADYRRDEAPQKPADISPQELLEAKRVSVPLSQKLSAAGDEHVLMFYYLHGFSSSIYRPWPDTLVIYEANGDELHIYDILSPRKIPLEQVFKRIAPAGAQRAVLHFTPDEKVKGLKAEPDPEAGWMTRGGAFPAGACFPKISQT